MRPLPPMPPRIAALPLSDRGYPVPWFVAEIDGKPDFRVADAAKRAVAIREHRCWVCGQKLGKFRCFVLGPMCVVNRNTAEPPCHTDCAEWSVQACPFLLNPNMVRREQGKPEDAVSPGGIAIEDNPGITALYTCLQYRAHADGGGVLFALGDPVLVGWWKEGRSATRAEVEDVLARRLPIIESFCTSPEEKEELARYAERARRYLPIK